MLLPISTTLLFLQAPAGSYTVQLGSLDRAHVTAEFRPAPAELFMNTSAVSLADGFASFLHDLKASGADGREVVLTRNGARWRVPDAAGQSLRVQYDVDLSFARQPWPAGNEQAGYTDGKALFVVSKALFLDCERDGPRAVRFELPAGWSVEAPWERGAAPGSFTARDSTSLLINSLVLGAFTATTTRAEQFEFTLVSLGDFGKSTADVAGTLSAVVKEFVRIFPRTPPTRYLVTMLAGAEDDGEAYATSFATTLAPPLDEHSRIGWANGCAHELFHFWCGHLVHGEGTELVWFTEGFTEYYANLGLVRTGAFTTAEFLSRLEHNLGHYQYFMASPLFGTTTLLQAGAKKSENRFGVYGGGWAIALGLDHLIRTATGEEKSLDDLMRLLVEEYGGTGQALPFDDLAAIVGDLAGDGARDWLIAHVRRRSEMDVRATLKAFGLASRSQAYDGELHAWPDPLADPGALRRRKSWAGF